jgi:predicted metal-dependent HD superfamily phosphohydrolase
MTDRTSREAWEAVWYGLGGRPGSPELHRDLCDAYADPQRAYHTLDHVAHCLDGLAQHAALAERPCEVAVALWFHDAVYDPRATDNEARSAAWAVAALREHDVRDDAVARVRAMILATRDHGGDLDGDTALLVDLDLAILGQSPDVFDRYDAAIRVEYAWVAEPAYRTARTRVLRAFLDRRAIYRCAPLYARFEAPARANLARAIGRLVG